jgi:hypothetical protein
MLAGPRSLAIAAAVSLSAYVVPAWAEMLSGQIVGQEMSQDWASLMVSHGSDIRIRATTVNSTRAGIYFDFIVPGCGLYLELGLPFSKPSDTDIGSVQIPVALRVDTNEIIPLQGKLNPVSMGDDSYILSLPQLDDFGSFLSQMRAGQVLRVKIGFKGDKQYYYVFSLRGFSGAFDRARTSCAEIDNTGNKPPPASSGAASPRRHSPSPPPSDPSKWF